MEDGMRAKGVVVTMPDNEPTGSLADEAKQIQKKRQERKIIEGRKPPAPVPNRICYAELYEQWKANGGGRLPKCNKCGGTLHWEENHACPGFIPRYRDLDPETRRAMREAKMENEGDWDDDQYDPTTPGEVIRDPDEEDSGVVIEGMTEEEYLMEKFGYLPRWDEL
jgi:hypothetical protein